MTADPHAVEIRSDSANAEIRTLWQLVYDAVRRRATGAPYRLHYLRRVMSRRCQHDRAVYITTLEDRIRSQGKIRDVLLCNDCGKTIEVKA